MALLPLTYYSEPVLHKKAESVTQFDEKLAVLIQEMYETMYHEKGVGLAAPQIGVSKRIAVIDISEERNQPFCIINPVFLEKQGEVLMGAGCLSVPGTYGEVPRATYVKVQAQDVKGEFFTVEGEGLLAHCLQHEIDHLDGVVYIDYLSPLKKQRALKKMETVLRRGK